MKKSFCTMFLLLLFTLLFVTPVQATELPKSFDFAISVSMDGENSPFIENFQGGIYAGISGTFSTESLTTRAFLELHTNLEPILYPFIQVLPPFARRSLDFNEPIRLWLDVDLTNTEAPTLTITMQMPRAARLPLAFIYPGLMRQYWVLDLGEALLSQEAEIDIVPFSSGRLTETLYYIRDIIALFPGYITTEITNINTAKPSPAPAITAENSHKINLGS